MTARFGAPWPGIAEYLGVIDMKMQQHDDQGVNIAPDTASSDERPSWVAPRQSIQVFSIAEFTQLDSNPGDDGLGVFTGS